MHLYEIEVSVLERGVHHTPVYSYIVHICIHTYSPTYLLTYTHTKQTYIHTNMHAYLHTYIHTYIHTCIYTYIHTYIHVYIHTYMYIYIHTGIFGSICAAIVCEHMGVARGDMCSLRPLSTRLFQIPNPGVFTSNVAIKQIQDVGWQPSVGCINVYGSFIQES